MARKKILFIGGSLNMTRMTHAVARHLQDEFDCRFSPFYADGLYDFLATHTKLVNFTALGGNFRRQTDAYLRLHDLPVDYRGQTGDYDLYVVTTDLVVPRNLKGKPFILIQEGMTDPEGIMYHIVRKLRLPRFLASTSTNGLSQQYRYFCVASEGYRDFFIKKGIQPEKLLVTGIPNFDHSAACLDNDFPLRDYVLVATSDARETYKFDNRKKFLRNAVQLAAGRPMIFKLHPNEKFDRAIREIHDVVGDVPIYTDGNIDHMIANCDALICQYSTIAYTGLALGKEVHSYFDLEMLRRLAPMQNGGTSGRNIAQVCRHILRNEPVSWEEFLTHDSTD